MTTLYLIVAILGYLLGSITFGYVLVKLFRGEDVRSTGSGNIGATNVARTGSKGLAIATLALDALKGAVAVLVARALVPARISPLPYMAIAALAAVLGHLFPVWLKFKGGKGVATALGVFLVLFPEAVLVSLAIFIVTVLVTRYVSLGSILAAVAFPIAAYFIGSPDWQTLLPACAISLLIVLKHHANIARLLSGTEHRFGSAKTAEKQA
ncbi:MAG TPA: glycerol-3-phosphate 1-O-acyltransferase PlsY [Candidatus Angelobacter sp.]|nr:glycerol-3-phosphate 1-O-acyltransferase PlsY [Candidatus Angelobacter sp.]